MILARTAFRDASSGAAEMREDGAGLHRGDIRHAAWSAYLPRGSLERDVESLTLSWDVSEYRDPPFLHQASRATFLRCIKTATLFRANTGRCLYTLLTFPLDTYIKSRWQFGRRTKHQLCWCLSALFRMPAMCERWFRRGSLGHTNLENPEGIYLTSSARDMCGDRSLLRSILCPGLNEAGIAIAGLVSCVIWSRLPSIRICMRGSNDGRVSKVTSRPMRRSRRHSAH